MYDPMPKSRIPLRYRGYYGDRPFVYRSILPLWWTVCLPEGGSAHFTTFDEAIHEAHRLARVRAERENPSGEQPPIEAVRALMQAAWA